MDSLGLPTPRAIDDCSPKQPTIFYLLLTRRTICDTPSTVTGTREAPSMLRVNDDMRTRSAAGRSTTGIMASQLGVRPPEPSQRRPRLAVLPGDGRGTTTTTPLIGTHIIPDNRKTRVECLPLLHALGPFNGPPNFKVSNVDKYEPKQDPEGWLAVYTTAALGRDECILTHYPRARHTTMAATSTPTLHRRLERL
jgi:hypothetical protein